MEEKFDERTVALTACFRAPSYAPAHRRAQDTAGIPSRGLPPTAWCSGVIRAPLHFDLSRWFPRYPRSWLNRGVWMEMPYAPSYLAHKLVEAFSAAWHVVNAEYFYFPAAGWVHTLLTDKAFAWLDAKALRRMSKLDQHLMASGPGDQATLGTFQKRHKATEVFPWTIVVRDVIRRGTQTRAARQVHVHLDSSAEYGFVLNDPCRDSASVPACGGGSDDDGDTPVAAAQGSGGFVRQGTRAAGGPSCRQLLLAVVRCRRYALPPLPEDMGVRRWKTFGLRVRRFRRRWPGLATERGVVWTGSACLVESGRPPWLRRGMARWRHCAGRFVMPKDISLRTPCRSWLEP